MVCARLWRKLLLRIRFFRSKRSCVRQSFYAKQISRNDIDAVIRAANSPGLTHIEDLWGTFLRDAYKNHRKYNSVEDLREDVPVVGHRRAKRSQKSLHIYVKRIANVLEVQGRKTELYFGSLKLVTIIFLGFSASISISREMKALSHF